ncbi:hypothetical protein FB45DRAFT_732704 [Roridomyces roridus]|uniref:F-box domain-containing protein n=1 Tax=Roridomyces roridus TaxID=1738132 RepID=A0AAD7CE08_9AGAR|nr:hypothetical protein FB45DRAFT_732704 [Roridomyces roridus]
MFPPSTTAHLLASNSAPDGIESNVARSYIAGLEYQRAALENTIALQMHHHAHLVRFIQDHKLILAPIRRLPTELLAEIFKVAAREASAWGCLPGRLPPRTLIRVCRRWADVALGTPSLWSRAYLNLDDMGVREEAVTMTQLLHQRSGNTPLTIRIYQFKAPRQSLPIVPNVALAVLNVALAHCDRWQHVEFRSSETSPLLY